MSDIRILCGTFHLRIDGRTGGVEIPDLLALIWKYFTSGWTAGAGKRAHRIERRSIGEWIRRIIHVTRKDIYESEVSFKRKTGVDFGALTGCEHGNCVAEQRAESNLVLQD
jgi:hypothetical protein